MRLHGPWTVSGKSLSMGPPRQEYLNGLSFPSPGDFPDQRINPVSLALASGFFFFTTETPGKPVCQVYLGIKIMGGKSEKRTV